jgi:hypothetical protein
MIMRTFDVTLSSKKRIVFPPRCVVCEAENPAGKLSLSFLGATSPSVSTMAVDVALDNFDPKYYGSNTSNEVGDIPACEKCAAGLKWYHRCLKLAYYTAWIPGLIFLLAVPAPIFVNILIFFVVVISPGILTLIFPPSFGATFMDNTANFEFKSKIVADEFLRLNPEARLNGGEPKTETEAIKVN